MNILHRFLKLLFFGILLSLPVAYAGVKLFGRTP
jgi:hypothetical protein